MRARLLACASWTAPVHDDASRAAIEGPLGPIIAEAMGPAPGGVLDVHVELADLRPRATRADRAPLNPNYTFDNFVIGPSNRLAHASALAVSESPGGAYNPLFIHAGVGLGKTHLLQAVCHRLVRRRPRAYVLFTSCDEFQNRYISAVQDARLDEFRDWVRRAEALVIDDVHFLSQRERTQEEFFHVFNSLYNAHRQIILSSDSPPAEIPSIENRLVSRFRWGLVAEIDRPTYETRLEIIRRKASMRGEELPDTVLQMIASSGAANIRELEGAVIRLLGYAALMKCKIDDQLAAEVLGSEAGSPAPRRLVSLDEIQRAVAEFFSVSVPELQSKSKVRSLAHARHAAMYLARKLTGASLKETGGHFGGRDHSTVKYACDKVAAELAEGGRTAAEIDELERALLSRAAPRGRPG